MDLNILYNLPDFANSAMPMGWPIAIYFFLTGSMAGLYITSVIATLMKKEEWKPTAKIGAVGALVLLMSAPFLSDRGPESAVPLLASLCVPEPDLSPDLGQHLPDAGCRRLYRVCLLCPSG